MTPPSSLGRHRPQQAPAGEAWPSADPPLRRLAAPPSSLTVPVAGEWLERGGRSPDLPVVHYCNANILQGSVGSVDGCVHIRGMSDCSIPASPPPIQHQRRQLSSVGESSTVAVSPSSPPVTRPRRSPAPRDNEPLNDSRASRRRPLVDDGGQLYDIDAIMQELAVDVERIVDSVPSSSRLVDQSVQISNLAPASLASGHHHLHAAFSRPVDGVHLLHPGTSDPDHRLRRTASHATTSAAMQPPLGAVKFTSVNEPSRPINLVLSNGVVYNHFVANNDSGRSLGAADHGVRALANDQVKPKVSPPPLPPPPAHQRDAHLLHGRLGSSAFKPVSSGANNRSLGLQLSANNADLSPLRATRPVHGVSRLTAEPLAPVRRRVPDSSAGPMIGPAPSFRVRRSVCVTSLPRLCRSLENIASDVDDSGPRSGSSSRPDSPAAGEPRRRRATAVDNQHQLLLLHPDDVSLSSFDGTASEMSRSDPALSSYGDTSEYDNYRPGMASDEDYFVPEPISDVDIDLFDDVDVDNVEVSDTYAALDAVGIPPLRRRVVDDV